MLCFKLALDQDRTNIYEKGILNSDKKFSFGPIRMKEAFYNNIFMYLHYKNMLKLLEVVLNLFILDIEGHPNLLYILSFGARFA